MTNQLTFNNTNLSIINRDNQIWLTAPEIANALKYKDQSSVNRIYSRNSDEFTLQMSTSVKLTDHLGVSRDTRIFSLRGAHLIAMFARTEIAKEFRRWVLDILDKEVQSTIATPLNETHHLALTDYELYNLVCLYKAANIMRQKIELVQPALDILGSQYSSNFFSMSVEYKRALEEVKEILLRETTHIQTNHFTGRWNTVLHALRN